MPIYEYQAKDGARACQYCAEPFEVLQGILEEPLCICPQCGNTITKVMSWCRAAVIEADQQDVTVTRAVKEYEKAGMWSHAAELADKHSEKTKDKELKTRALENYKRAGYDLNSLSKHAE
jgi:putative FmdB family regulatory protein